MYKIINITDRAGNVKETFIKELRQMHPDMKGLLLYPLSTAQRLCFVWADKSEKMLRTSPIESYKEDVYTVTVITENSIYTLERVK